MTNEEMIKNFYKPLMAKIMSVEKKLDGYTTMRVNEVTPYTETKTAYIGDTSVTFTNTPNGNLTVYFPYEYTVERMADRITVSFEELDEVTEITISIL
jgi:hypothetical protein